MEEIAMNYIALKNLLRDQSGQDLIEYWLPCLRQGRILCG
jgi:hypothetical protein